MKTLGILLAMTMATSAALANNQSEAVQVSTSAARFESGMTAARMSVNQNTGTFKIANLMSHFPLQEKMINIGTMSAPKYAVHSRSFEVVSEDNTSWVSCIEDMYNSIRYYCTAEVTAPSKDAKDVHAYVDDEEADMTLVAPGVKDFEPVVFVNSHGDKTHSVSISAKGGVVNVRGLIKNSMK